MAFAAGLCIGINDYPGTDSDLGGCVNDARDWAAKLCPFAKLLLNKKAVKEAILDGMASVVEKLSRGEWGLITYSGHGSWIPDENGDEPDGRDEVLVPYDWAESSVVDDELFAIWQRLKPGARVLFINDSCQNGGVVRLGPGHNPVRIRFLPPESRLSPARLRKATRLATSTPAGKAVEIVPGVVHMAGCRNSEYCYDANFGKRGNGAFTHAALQALRTRPTTFSAWLANIHRLLPSQSYPQTPLMNAEVSLKRAKLPFAT